MTSEKPPTIAPAMLPPPTNAMRDALIAAPAAPRARAPRPARATASCPCVQCKHARRAGNGDTAPPRTYSARTDEPGDPR